MDRQEIIRNVKRIEIKTRLLVEGLVQGDYHSVFKGRGIEFNEAREYAAGDDIRTIDWNVTARMGVPYVKEFIEERDLTVYIVFDCSGSGEFGNAKEKRETAIELAATVMFAAIRNNDRVGLALFSDRIERFIPARKGKRHALSLISTLLSHESASRRTDIATSLSSLASILRRKSIVIILSDFLSEGFERELSILSRRHDVIAAHLTDERELEVPDVGYILMEDEETGEQMLVDTGDEGFRSSYQELAIHDLISARKSMTRSRCGVIPIENGKDNTLALKQFFRKRRRAR